MAPVSELLSRLPYFQGLTANQIDEVSRAGKELFFQKGEVLFVEGEPCRGLYVVKSGQVRIFKSSLEGRAVPHDRRTGKEFQRRPGLRRRTQSG